MGEEILQDGGLQRRILTRFCTGFDTYPQLEWFGLQPVVWLCATFHGMQTFQKILTLVKKLLALKMLVLLGLVVQANIGFQNWGGGGRERTPIVTAFSIFAPLIQSCDVRHRGGPYTALNMLISMCLRAKEPAPYCSKEVLKLALALPPGMQTSMENALGAIVAVQPP